MDNVIETGPARENPFSDFCRRRRRWRQRAVAFCLAFVVTPVLAQDAAILVRVEGPDALYGFTSATPALNFSISTMDGAGRSPEITVPTGQHSLVADDLSGVGIPFTGVSCSGGTANVQGDSRTIDIDLNAGDLLDCIFSATLSPQRTSELVSGFLTAQGNLLVATLPGSQNRIDRLNNTVVLAPSPKPFLESLPGLIAGGPVPLAGSLAALDRLAGKEQQNDFDLWIEGTFGLYGSVPPDSRFGIMAVGSDYRISEDLLAGGFFELDAVERSPIDRHMSIGGSGWTVGGYATARISERLYLDVIGGIGRAANVGAPAAGDYTRFDANRYLLSASLLGNWAYENWTFTPQAKLSYVEEASNGSTMGAEMLPVRTGMGQIAIGPAISYKVTTPSEVVVETGLRLDTGFNLLAADSSPRFSGHWARVEGTVNLILPEGAQLGTSIGYDGIGTDQRVFSARGKLSLPLR